MFHPQISIIRKNGKKFIINYDNNTENNEIAHLLSTQDLLISENLNEITIFMAVAFEYIQQNYAIKMIFKNVYKDMWHFTLLESKAEPSYIQTFIGSGGFNKNSALNHVFNRALHLSEIVSLVSLIIFLVITILNIVLITI